MNMKYHIIALLFTFCQCAWSKAVTATYLKATTGYYYYHSSNSSSLNNGSCIDSKTELPSLTYVVDTTGSMYLLPLQEMTRILFNSLSASSHNVTRQYTLMEFNDPSVGPLRVTCSATNFVNYINLLYAYDGGDCPEYALTGLLQALEISPPGSLIILATDASAKDSNDSYIVNRIFSLLDSKQAKVFILGARPCFSALNYDFQIYKDIAAHSFGHVFQNTDTDVASLFNFLLQIPLNSTTRLLSIDYDYYYYDTHFFVSTNFTSLIVTTACSDCTIRIYTPSGAQAYSNRSLSKSWGSLIYVENPNTGLWTININAPTPFTIRILGYKGNNISNYNTSSICSKCSTNASCRRVLLSYTCVCNEGFSGDGYSCYDINECDYYYSGMNPCNDGYCDNTYGSYNCICSHGFTFKNKTCVDVDECSRPELNGCHALATCYNYYGSYSCSCPAGYFGNGYQCEVDECTRDVCGFARECIKSNGSHTCLDPCYGYTTLNEPSRSTSYRDYYHYLYYYYDYGRSDNYLNGWYRFEGSGGIRIAEFCPDPGSCYTRSPIWMNERHPDQSDGIVNRTICTSYYDYCCYWTSNIKIKACPGNYYVYKLSETPTYYAGYCTDPATVADSCSCADDEECKLVGGRYGCYCKHTDDVSALQDLRPELTCGNQEIKASFLKCHLQKFNVNTKNIHLRDKSCTGFSDFNMTNIISVISILKNGVCGNELVNNKTHIIYKNTIYLSMDSSLGGEDIISIGYSCVYPLDMQLSLETALQPFSSSVDVSVEGTGQLLATIALYQDSSYRTPYEGSQVLLTSKTILYVGILLKSGDSTDLSVLMKNCYATPSRNPSSSAKYDILKDSCPSKQDSTINVIENGNSQTGRFSVQLFGYVKDSNVVYLHCDIHICDRTSEVCTPFCSGVRALRTYSGATDKTLSLGPIIRQVESSTITEKPPSDGATSLMAHMMMAVLLVTGDLLFIIYQ